MIYLAIDTCVWFDLLKTDFLEPNNHFDELLFWIDKGEIGCITTENLLREWDRNNSKKKSEIIKSFKSKEREIGTIMSGRHSLTNGNLLDKMEEILDKRIDRLEKLFTTNISVAPETNDIYIDAAKRNFNCIAPNHIKDSFRDTVNILTIKQYALDNELEGCIFTTINHSDYSDPLDRKIIHNQLQNDLDQAKMEYCYFDNSPDNFSGRLFRELLRPSLPSFNDFLINTKKKEEEKKLKSKKIERLEISNITDPDFVENTLQIDRIVLLEKRSKLDDKILEILFEMNPRYEQYFFKKLIENGLV